MLEKIFVFVSYILISTISLLGQCPDKDSLWRRLVFLRDASNLSPKEQLAELLPISVEINSCPYRNDSTQAFLLRRIGANYYLESDYTRAIQYYLESIKIVSTTANSSRVNVRDLVSSYYFLSVFYSSLDNVNEEMNALDSCVAYAIQLQMTSDIACVAALYKKVEYSFDVGDYHRCVNYAMMCEKFAWEYASHETEKANVMAGITNAESSLLWRVKAMLILKEYESVETLLINKVDEYRRIGLENYLGTLYSQLAEVQVNKGNYKQALLFYNTSLRNDQKAGYNFNCKQTLKDIGYYIYFRHFADLNTALIYYKRAFAHTNKDITRSVADIFESLNIYTLIANVYVRKGKFDLAYYYYQLAFNQIKPGINESDILHSPPAEFIKNKKIYYLTRLLIDKADAYKEQYKYTGQKNELSRALSIYRITDQLLDKIRAEQTELESKLFWRSDTRHLFENAIETCYLQNDPISAIYFFERSRAVLLNDQLSEQRWLGEKDILRLAILNKKILQGQRELETLSPSSIRARKLQTELFEQAQNLDRLKKTIHVNNPLYYQNFLDTNALTLSDIQKYILKDHQAIVEIFSGDSSIYSLIITVKEIHLSRINKVEYDSLVDNYIGFISDPGKANRNFNGFINTSRSLYELIFKNNSLPPGRIIISSDGRYFPFEALITNNSSQFPAFFLNDHAVSYTYSIRYLLNSFATDSEISVRDFMGIAPIHYPAAMSLSTLDASDRSLERLRTYFPKADNFIESNASKKNFLQQFYKYKIIQLYTHASDTSSRAEPVIYFSDSSLYLSDLISDYIPAASLIVLSACETGKGKLYKGEGVFSFNRGFAAIGIPSSIINLWSVENESTYKLTELFYKYLTKGLPMDVAMQKAKLAFISTASGEKKLPYYWAACVLVGKSDSIEIEKTVSWKIIVPIIVAAGLAVFVVYKRFKNKKVFFTQ